MNINDKVNIFTSSMKKFFEKDICLLEKNINSDIENQIQSEIEEYQKIEELAYQKKLEKLDKEFNKQIYLLEMESKKEILNEKKKLQKELENEVIKLLKDFTNNIGYEDFLYKNINEILDKVKYSSNSILSITSKDFDRFGEKIKQKYNINVEIMEEKYIGGCIFEDRLEGIYIDNSIKNGINEKIN